MADKQEIQGMEYKVDSNTFSVVDDDDIAKANQNSKQSANSKTQSTSEKQNSEPPSNQGEGDDKTLNGKQPTNKDEDKTQDSEPPSNPHEGEYLACQGAKCQCDCDASRALVELVVKNDHHVINSEGQDKLVASVIENNFKSPFGTCKNNPSSGKPCVYQAMPTNKWRETSESKLPTVDGHAVLLESATLICPIFKGNITFLTHGQTVNVAPADAEQTDTAAANAICCTNEPIKDKTPKGKAPIVSKISYIKSAKNKKSIDSDSGKKIKKITIRINTPVTFKGISASANKNLISWAIWDRKGEEAKPLLGDEKDIFWYYGDTLTTEFAAEGDYFIEGFGKMNPNSDVTDDNKRTRIWTDCMLLVHVQKDNEILKIAGVGKSVEFGSFDNVDGNEYKLSAGKPYIFKPEFLFTPTEEDIATLTIKLYTDDKGTISNSFVGKEALALTLNLNCEGAYYIKGSVCGHESRDNTKILAIANEMIGLGNETCAIAQNPTAKVRPGTPITFTANLRNGNDAGKVVWTIDGRPSGSGKTLNVSKLSVGKHTITAEYKRTVLGIKLNSDKQTIKDYTIAKQEVTDVVLSSTQVFASGMSVDIKASTVYADDNNGSEKVEYMIVQLAPYQVYTKEISIHDKWTFTPPAIGVYTVGARISNSTKWIYGMPLVVIACRIEAWEFCDSKKRKRTKLGWKQTVYIHIKIAGMENQSATIHLWYDDQGRNMKTRFHEINEASLKNGNKFDSNGEVFIKVCEDAAWKQIEGWKEDEMRLCFTVEKEMICANSKKGLEKDNHIYPAESEKALYDGSTLTINTIKEKYDGVFLKKNGEEAIEILPYSEPATAIAYVMGRYVKDTQQSDIPKNKYRMEIWQNKIYEDDLRIITKSGLEADEEGAIKVDNIQFKEDGHPAKLAYLPRMFYFKLYDEKTNKYLMSYPDDGGKNNEYNVDWNKENDGTKGEITEERKKILRNYFKELKFAKDLKFNTNIDNAAVKIGCKKKEGKKCENCVCKQYNLLWDDKVTCEFRKKVVEICRALWGTRGEREVIKMANGLMAVMAVETNNSFSACIIEGRSKIKDRKEITASDFKKIKTITKKDGKKTTTETSRAVGLIQFTQGALESMGEFKSGQGFEALNALKLSYAQMSDEDQLDKVKKYFEKSATNIKTPEDIYLHIFAPIGVGQPDSKILYQGGTIEYESNKSVDTKDGDDNGDITRKEILNRYRESVDNGKGYRGHEYECDAANKTQEATNGWHDPVDNPQVNYYNSNGVVKPASATYGDARILASGKPKYHSGIDLFALPGTAVYACVDGKIIAARWSDSVGYIITLQPKDSSVFYNRQTEINYTKPKYKGEIMGTPFTSGMVYFIYMHLTDMKVKEGADVHAGDKIATSGVSGEIANGTRAPHLHFEVANKLNDKKNAGRQGKAARTNPARVINLQEVDINKQKDTNKIYKGATREPKK